MHETLVVDQAADVPETRPTTRRNLLAAGAGALAALVANAVAVPSPTLAATSVKLGDTNNETSPTVIRTTSGRSDATAISGQVTASSPGSSSAGVMGVNKGPSGSSGVRGKHTAAGRGVHGTSATGTGVYGRTSGNAGAGVKGLAPNSIGSALSAVGVLGDGTVGVEGSGEYMGVQGSSPNYAVFGFTTPDTGGIGVYGRGAQGVKGRSYAGQAVLGDTDSGTGVKGEAYADGGAVKAVHGQGFGSNNNGVVGEASNGTAAYGVWGISSTGYAGVFSGKVLVTGTLSKGGGSFRIDHPLDPEHKFLSHSFVESPDMMNVYNGNVVTDAKGLAVVRLPRYFGALNRDFRYQLTVIGTMANAVIDREIDKNRFRIRSSAPEVKVSWQVTGIRKDPFANKHRIKVEQTKPKAERGLYLHPAEHGQPASRGFQHARIDKDEKRSRRKRDAELRRPKG